jgi:hypothetical protein
MEGLRWENVDIFYGHLEYFKDIWEILRPFGTFCVDLVHFSGFGIMYQQKSGNPVPRDNFAHLSNLMFMFTYRGIQSYIII